MSDQGGGRRAELVRTGWRLGRERRGRKAFSPLVLVTDPARTPDPVALAATLPRGAAVIYRAFGAEDALTTGLALRAVTTARGVLLLVGADEALAAKLSADGLHLPERRLRDLPRLRARRPEWILTVAAHSARALRSAERAGADAVLLSAVFPSLSPSAASSLGPLRFAAMIGSVEPPVLALGGVTGRTAPRLLGTGCAGLAAIDGWRD
jgi:thiamine-phosphate pyrophosphorylase